MVTMPSEAATNPQLVRDLLMAGMDIMRINCAHDSPEAWRAMVDNLRCAEREVGRSCRIQADLGGPKLRTGPLEAAGRLLKIRPKRDYLARVISPVPVWLTPSNAPEVAPEGVRLIMPVDQPYCWKRRNRAMKFISSMAGAAIGDCASSPGRTTPAWPKPTKSSTPWTRPGSTWSATRPSSPRA